MGLFYNNVWCYWETLFNLSTEVNLFLLLDSFTTVWKSSVFVKRKENPASTMSALARHEFTVKKEIPMPVRVYITENMYLAYSTASHFCVHCLCVLTHTPLEDFLNSSPIFQLPFTAKKASMDSDDLAVIFNKMISLLIEQLRIEISQEN